MLDNYTLSGHEVQTSPRLLLQRPALHGRDRSALVTEYAQRLSQFRAGNIYAAGTQSAPRTSWPSNDLPQIKMFPVRPEASRRVRL
jgi:hypothetical protein